jgi:hypothetical protein
VIVPASRPHEVWPVDTMEKAKRADGRHAFARWGLPERIRVANSHPGGSANDLPPGLALWLIGWGSRGSGTRRAGPGAIPRSCAAMG